MKKFYPEAYHFSPDITSTKPHEWSVGLHMITKKHRALFSERKKSTNFLRKTQMKKRSEGSTVIGPPGGARNTIKTKTNQCFQIKSINQLILTFTTVFERVILIFLLDYRFINNDILLIGRVYIPLLHGNALLFANANYDVFDMKLRKRKQPDSDNQ